MTSLPSPRRAVTLKRFTIKTPAEVLTFAATTFLLDLSGLEPSVCVSVVNSVRNLLHGDVELHRLKQSTLKSICTALKIPLPEEESKENFCALLEHRFYDASTIRALTTDEVKDADFRTLVFWADALDITIPITASRDDVAKLITDFQRTGIHEGGDVSLAPNNEVNTSPLRETSRKRQLDDAFLVDCPTDDLRRIGHEIIGPDLLPTFTRRQLVSELRNREVEASSFPPELLDLFRKADTPSENTATRMQVLDSWFSSPSSLPSEMTGKFISVPKSQLSVGHVLADVSTDEPVLFRVLECQPDIIVQSILDHEVKGCLVSVEKCWAATKAGLTAIASLLPTEVQSVVIPADVIELSEVSGSSGSSAPMSVLALCRQPPSELGLRYGGWGPRNGAPPFAPHPAFPAGPASSSSSEGLTQVRLDRYEASRGFRTLLGHDMSRFMDITNNTGRCDDDRAFNNVIVGVHQDDRSLPALSRVQLKYVLMLQFSLQYDPAKPLGLHLQAFRNKGAPFYSTVQIHDALLKMVRILDTIRCPGSRFFYTLFCPLLESLTSSDELGLSQLSAPYAIEVLSNVLLVFGCKANSPAADSWITQELQHQNLAPCLEVDVARHCSIAALRSLKEQEKSKDHGRRPPLTGRGRSGRGGRGQGAAGYSRSPSTTATPVTSGLTSPSVTPPKGLCISALFENYSLGSGCRKLSTGTCPFNHNVATAPKDEQRAAASRVLKDDKKRQLLSAIG